MAEVRRLLRQLSFEQRVAGVGALLLLVSTFGPFSFVEAAEALVALGVLWLLRARAEGKRFQLPFGDGAVIAAGAAWSGVLILVRLFDRPLGQNLLALACAAMLLFAGLRQHARREGWDQPQAYTPPDEARTEPLTPRAESLGGSESESRGRSAS